MKTLLASLLLVAAVAVIAPSPAFAQAAAWDQTKVTALARDLEVATRLLYDGFDELPPLEKGARHTRAYFRLKQEVRHMKRESRWLARALERGHTQEEALPGFESVVTAMNGARKDAAEVKTTAEFQKQADSVSGILAALAPYFGASAAPAAQ